MKRILQTEGEQEFWVSDRFEGEMLSPVILNLLDKAQKGWDDYDEVYHCMQLIEQMRANPEQQMDFHTLCRCGQTVGLCLVTRGKDIPQTFLKREVQDGIPAEKRLMFHYFHIAPDARGCGEHWFKEIIQPYYAAQGFAAIYLKSSHPRAFSLYARLGSEIGTYTARSDTRQNLREGRIYRIDLKN